jgi:hypothetical protein
MLGKPNPFAPVMMPKRVALTDPVQQLSKVLGGGPQKFVRLEW